MPKLILTRGIPASGKSTWAKAWVQEDPQNRLRVNRDNLRWTLGVKEGVGSYQQEQEVTYWQREMAKRALRAGNDVVVDDMNLRAKFVKEWIAFAQKEGAFIEFQDFPISVDDAVTRDMIRLTNGQRSVGEIAIRSIAQKFLGKNGELPAVPEIPEAGVEFELGAAYDPTLADAIIVDIDGTLAHMTNRGPYDTSKYMDDSLDEIVADMVARYEHDHQIIIVSGRSADFKDVLIEWLDKHDVAAGRLYMRPSGDTRNDAVVKNELYEQHIRGKFNIKFVLDDRDRVVAMWRAKGLKVLQVEPGDF